eukprot:2947358-Rhodomonas_salina.3
MPLVYAARPRYKKRSCVVPTLCGTNVSTLARVPRYRTSWRTRGVRSWQRLCGVARDLPYAPTAIPLPLFPYRCAPTAVLLLPCYYRYGHTKVIIHHRCYRSSATALRLSLSCYARGTQSAVLTEAYGGRSTLESLNLSHNSLVRPAVCLRAPYAKPGTEPVLSSAICPRETCAESGTEAGSVVLGGRSCRTLCRDPT